MNTKFKFATLLMLVGLLVFTACKKEDTDPKEEESTYDNSSAPKSNAIIETSFDEMTNMSDQAINDTLVFYRSPKVKFHYAVKGQAIVKDKTPCNVNITIDTTSTTRSIEIDWGTTNCDCNDGKQRRGKIITTFTGKYRDLGTVITHTPVGYYVNDNHIEGTKTVTNMGFNGNNQPYFNVNIDGTVTMSSGEVFTYSSSRVRTWTAGFNTFLNFLDDEYDITGSATASSSEGNGYTANITTALHVQVGCPFVKSGVLEFTPTNKPVRIIDYGNGTCDATFTVTVNGVTYTVN